MAKTMTHKALSDTKVRGAFNRAIRQEDLRERIAQSNVLTMIERIENVLLDETVELDAIQVARKGKALDSCHKRLAKILPDLKSVEISRNAGGSFDLSNIPDDLRQSLRQSVLDAIGIRERVIDSVAVSVSSSPTGANAQGAGIGGRGETSDGGGRK
jgi:hypothetical protein